jgi:hypothetical protein
MVQCTYVSTRVESVQAYSEYYIIPGAFVCFVKPNLISSLVYAVVHVLQKADYDAFERDRQLTALQFRTLKKKGRPLIEREHSMRGLEDLVDWVEGENSKSPGDSERTEHLRRVLEEQARQRLTGCYPNDTMLREISCKSSREARQRSARVGEADALAGHVSSSKALQRRISGGMNNLSRKLQP